MGTGGVTLATVQNHLEQGYFTQDDMDLLGLKGFVTVAQMQAELGSLLTSKVPIAPVVDPNAALRAEASQAAAQKEAREAADRAALIQSISDQAAQVKAVIDFRNAVIASGGIVN